MVVIEVRESVRGMSSKTSMRLALLTIQTEPDAISMFVPGKMVP